MTWFDRLQSKRTRTHRLDPDQLATIVAAIDNRGGGTFNQIILLKIARRLKEMALNFTKVEEGIIAIQGQMVNLQTDAAQIKAVVDELRAGANAADQEKLDQIGDGLLSIANTAATVDAALDTISGIANETPAPEPTPEP